jgi:hypothetical protein
MNTKVYPLDKFTDFDSAYCGMGLHSNGKIYFALCSHIPGKSAGFFSFDPNAEKINYLFSLAAKLPAAHGKIHTPILEGLGGKMYFGSHFAYPYGKPTAEVDYEGGHLLAYNPTGGEVTDFGIAHANEGILTMAFDVPCENAYLLTVPSGYLIKFNVASKAYRMIGKIPSNGSICRTIAVDKRGTVYGSYESNGLFIYNPKKDELLLRDKFFPDEQVQKWGATSRGGVNKIGRKLWRCVNYDHERDILYGIYSSSSRCFVLDCQTLRLEMHGPMVPGSYARAEEVYPTLSLVSNEESLFYIPADGMFDYCRSEKITNKSHLMTLNKTSSKIRDLGEIADGNRRVLGVAGAVRKGRELFLIGATDADGRDPKTLEEELFMLQGKPFDLSFIKIILPSASE